MGKCAECALGIGMSRRASHFRGKLWGGVGLLPAEWLIWIAVAVSELPLPISEAYAALLACFYVH